jgi:membrane-bound ClpP family serine protease
MQRFWNPALRDVLMFLLGATGFIHELVASGVERPMILTASLALMGLPFVLGADRKIGKGE